MRLKLHFADIPDSNIGLTEHQQHIEPTFRNKSSWTPAPNADVFLESYVQAIKQDLFDIQIKNISARNINLTPEQYDAITALKNNKSIVIKKADKGSATIVMNRNDYIKEGVRQLSDTAFYQKLEQDPLSDHQREIENTLLKIHQKGEISRKVLHHLLPSGTTTPEFYFLPKIHKTNITGRPIISGNNSPTERISAFVDEHIKILVPKIKSYVRDTPDFIRNIEEFRQTGHYFLVTMDVTSLYTNIPNHEGLVAVARSFINEQPKFTITYQSLLELLCLVLYKNNFKFNEEYYLQIGGTAMGTKVALSLANLFMGRLEEKLLKTAEERLNIKLPLYKRYIDDIFFIFPYSEDKLKDFMKLVNSEHRTIKFTEEHSLTEVVFVDCKVKRQPTGLYTDLYVKDTATYGYVRADSCHPKHITSKGPYSQFLRLCRNCFQDTDFEKHANDMKSHYLNRGYPQNVIDEAYTRAKPKNHYDLIHTATPDNSQTKSNRIPLILPFNPGNPDVMKIIKKHWHLLHYSEKCKELFPEPPLLAHRRSPNLSNLLVRATLPTLNPKPRLTPRTCDHDNCPVCEIIKSRTQIADRKGKTFKLAQNTCCQTENVIHALFFKVCHKIYVGETKRPFITRWKEHRADIKHKRDTPVARHNNDICKIPNGQDIQACILSKIRGNPSKTVALQKTREKWWIHTLQTYQPLGMNLMEWDHTPPSIY